MFVKVFNKEKVVKKYAFVSFVRHFKHAENWGSKKWFGIGAGGILLTWITHCPKL